MTKQKRILSFISVFIFTFIITIPNVLAYVNSNDVSYVQFYDNSGSSVSSITTEQYQDHWRGYPLTTVANSYGGLLSFNLDSTIVENHMYSLNVMITDSSSYKNTELSTKNTLGIGRNFNTASNSYINANDVSISYSDAEGFNLYYVFTAKTSGSYIAIPFTTVSTCSNCEFNFAGYELKDLGNAENLSQEEVDNIINNQTNEINNSITNTENNINNNIQNSQDNINSNIDSTKDEINNNINDMGESINGTINDNFNSCRPSNNLFPKVNLTDSLFTIDNEGIITINGTLSKNSSYKFGQVSLDSGTYTFSFDNKLTNMSYFLIQDTSDGSYINNYCLNTCTFTLSTYKTISFWLILIADSYDNFIIKPNLNAGTSIKPFEEHGKEICSNKIDDTNSKLEEANETSKGIWATIKDGISSIGNWFTDLANSIGQFFKDLLQGIIDGLKSLFIPSDEFFTSWWDDFSTFFDNKLGFLTTPIEIFIDFISSYLDLSSSTDILINIPDITVPNFEEHVIIEAQTFNWTDLLNSKSSFKDLWNLYLDFIDVFLILNFIGLCEVTYARIFGGDTSNYEYYTVEDSYTFDNDTGEVKSSRRNERTTTRKKVV